MAALVNAINLAREIRKEADFVQTFRPIPLTTGGLIVVSESPLGNVMADGTSRLPGPVSHKVSTHAGYLLMWGDENLLKGQVSQLSLIEGRSYKLKESGSKFLRRRGHCRRRPGG